MNEDAESRASKLRELATLESRVEQLRREAAEPVSDWRSTKHYNAYYATTGAMLGMFAAVTSLLFNVIGSVAINQHPLQLIRVYLTFPLGEQALTSPQLEGGMVLAIGCCLYIATGMLLGIPFQVLLSWQRGLVAAGDDSGPKRFFSGLGKRMLTASLLALLVWLVAYYAILSWLQPWLFGGSWIEFPSGSR